jgi:hypothetical protein
MAKPGSKAAKKRDPRIASEWPVHQYPYIVRRDYTDPAYFPSIAKAKAFLSKKIDRLATQHRALDHQDDLELCEKAAGAINQIGPEGGVVDECVDTLTGLRFRAEIQRRAEA